MIADPIDRQQLTAKSFEMNERRMQFGVGVMVFATMIIGGLLATVNEPMPASWLPWGKARYEIGIQLREAPGVGPNTPVRKNGILIGRVKSIEDLENGIVVHAMIDGNRPLYPEYQPHVRTSMLNDATIDFVTQPLKQGSQPVPGGTVFRGIVDPNPFDSLARLGDLQHDFSLAAQSLGRAGDEVSQLANRINTAFGSDTEVGRVDRLLDTTERAMHNFGQTMQAFNEILGDNPLDMPPTVPPSGPPRQPNGAPPTNGGPPLNMSPNGAAPLAARTVNMQQPTDVQIQVDGQAPADVRVEIDPSVDGAEMRRRIRAGLNELPDTIRETHQAMRDFRVVLESAERNFKNLEGLTEPLGAKGDQIANSIIEAVDGLDQLVENFTVLSEALNNREGTIGRLIHDPQLYQNANTLMCNANQVLAQINDLTLRARPILNDVRVFTDKIAREPGRVVTGGLNPSVVK